MATKIRLQKGGHKGYAFFRIVVADERAPRDGRFIEKIGTYNPNTNPSTIDLDFDRALYWVGVGAKPTDTVHDILRKEGVYFMRHLLGGVDKGAFDKEAAQGKFEAWKQEKARKAEKAREAVTRKSKDIMARRLEAERKVNEAIAKKVALKKAEKAAELAAQAAGAESAEPQAATETAAEA